jgi:transposase InsO family protein
MFVVITLTFQLIYAVIFLHHGRRKIIHFSVTDHPNQEWLTKQLIAALQANPKPKFLLRDRDSAYGRYFRDCVKMNGIQEVVTSPQSPWQNAYVERAIGSIRRECLNHVIVVSQKHLMGVLSSYVCYYNATRTHWALDKDAPVGRPIDPPSAGKTIVAIPQVGGLHHRYERRAF